MWGYIVTPYHLPQKCVVPSLYVRVYLLQIGKAGDTIRSLIICEGISVWLEGKDTGEKFPHYMWGYIGNGGLLLHSWHVPSLYVRVYHQHGKLLKSLKCSLIICEGISGTLIFGGWWILFPHYMWGYIALTSYDYGFKIVPSLYVRVYRCSVSVITPRQRSLIICEGISVTPPSDSRCQAFHHYM